MIEVQTKARLLVREVLRGGQVPERLMVAFRSPNLGRAPGTPGFRTEAGEHAVFVLTPWSDFDGDVVKSDLWVPAGGYAGKIPVPREGGPALLDAARQIIRYQDSGDPSGGVDAVAAWLSGPNPWLVDFALDQAAQLGLADRTMAPVLLARINDANPRRRAWSVAALGLALERGRFDRRRTSLGPKLDQDDEIGRSVREAIVRIARTDPDAGVRREAVKQFGTGMIPGGTEILNAIAKDDPDQAVRYEAAASLADLGALRVR